MGMRGAVRVSVNVAGGQKGEQVDLILKQRQATVQVLRLYIFFFFPV